MSAPRSGFSLVELIAVLALSGLVASMAVATITRQQRFYRSSAELRSAREGVRDAMEILVADIRGSSTADTIRLRADSAIELFAAIGSSFVCGATGNTVGLPASHASGNSLSSFLLDPDTGDVALFYVDSASEGGHWRRYAIASFASRSPGTSCPFPSPFFAASDVSTGARGFSVTVATPLSAAVRSGTPVRFIRRVRYSLYRAADGKSYLGYRRCNAFGASVCDAIQPISGPYRSYSGDAGVTGLLFEYFDAHGGRLTANSPSEDLARVVITARSEGNEGNPFSSRSGRIADSGRVAIAVRNLSR